MRRPRLTAMLCAAGMAGLDSLVADCVSRPGLWPRGPHRFHSGPSSLRGGRRSDVWTAGVRPSTPLHICNRLLGAEQRGEPVTAAPVDLYPFSAQGLRMEYPNGESASCMGPAGLPVDFSDGNQTWKAISSEERAPTDAEIGIDLVYAAASDLDGPACEALTGRRSPHHRSGSGCWTSLGREPVIAPLRPDPESYSSLTRLPVLGPRSPGSR